MPVYLCKPGTFASEPWRHGIPVYNDPFPLPSEDADGDEDSSRRPIRRIRHSEVILVDDVVMAHDQYWLKLRWPGTAQKFAGFICLVASQNTLLQMKDMAENSHCIVINEEDKEPETMVLEEEQESENNPASDGDMAGNANNAHLMRCLRNGLIFPSSPTLQLLPAYDDGLIPPVSLPIGSQSIFCRICRDGLHEQDDDDDQNNGNNTDENDAPNNNAPSNSNSASDNNNKSGDNPLLAPCECSGSMAFVHYLCVEQWRCRSRHPEARNGTHCETCGKPYALPPPSSRPQAVEDEWLEAMPPHVMQALRQPHLGWQMGAALVRRRWLRPLAPILLSPLVALYCRARRLLKKRGVSRRRWACSLCRRRARWKCVRCLRSYYCSRQCQNVSWHIVHKHVCYKPSRFWSSCVVYGILLLLVLPGVLKDPLLYDLALSAIPPSFYSMAILGGALATAVKRLAGWDMRGRVLEGVVLVCTAWLVSVSWGLVWAFFGQDEACWGWLGNYYSSDGTLMTEFLHRFVLSPAKTYFLFWDSLAARHLSSWICSANDPERGSCFPHLSQAYQSYGILESPYCVADLDLVAWIWTMAGLGLATQTWWRRPAGGGQVRNVNVQRPHQD